MVGTHLVQHRRKRHEDIWVSAIAIRQPRHFLSGIGIQPQCLELNGSTICRLLRDFGARDDRRGTSRRPSMVRRRRRVTSEEELRQRE